MTLVVVDTRPDQVLVMTDNLTTDASMRKILPFPGVKVVRMPGTAAAATSRGNVAVGLRWKIAAIDHSRRHGGGFDGLVDAMQSILRTLEGIDAAPFCAYAFGWSKADGGFRSVAAHTFSDLAPTDISGTVHVTPAPSGVEVSDVEASIDAFQGHAPAPAGRPADPLHSDPDWVALAQRIHADRSCSTARTRQTGRIVIGGKVNLTRIDDSGVHTKVIHTFGTADFMAATSGTLHPYGQIGLCPCGSGDRFIDCCIPKWLHLPCLCESGKTLGDCCALDAGGAQQLLDDHPELRGLTP